MQVATYFVHCTWHHRKDWLSRSYGNCFFVFCVVVVVVVVVVAVVSSGRCKSISKLEKENSVSVPGEVDCPFGRFQTWPSGSRLHATMATLPALTGCPLN